MSGGVVDFGIWSKWVVNYFFFRETYGESSHGGIHSPEPMDTSHKNYRYVKYFKL